MPGVSTYRAVQICGATSVCDVFCALEILNEHIQHHAAGCAWVELADVGLNKQLIADMLTGIVGIGSSFAREKIVWQLNPAKQIGDSLVNRCHPKNGGLYLAIFLIFPNAVALACE